MLRQYHLKLNSHILTGVIITLAGSFSYVLMGSLSKVADNHLALNQIMFLQSLAGLLCSACLMKKRQYSVHDLWRKYKHHYLLRIIFSLGSIYTLIAGLQQMSIFNALVILNSSPLIIPFLRRILFGNRISTLTYPAVICAFAGVALILTPDRQIFNGSFMMVAISMLCMTFSLLVLEKYQNAEPELSIFYYFFCSTVITGTIMIVHRQSLPLTELSMALGLIIGILFFLVQMSVIHAARYISSQLISVLFYSEIILALFSSILFEHQPFTLNHAAGILLVIGGGSMTTLIEQKFSLAKSNTHHKKTGYFTQES